MADPGFYFRVIEEGEVEAGEEIVQVTAGPERMTIAEVNALLYTPGHSRSQLERAVRIPARSAGWRSSFQALLDPEWSGARYSARNSRLPAVRQQLRRASTQSARRQCVIASAPDEGSPGLKAKATASGSFCLLKKPCRADTLIDCLQRALGG